MAVKELRILAKEITVSKALDIVEAVAQDIQEMVITTDKGSYILPLAVLEQTAAKGGIAYA